MSSRPHRRHARRALAVSISALALACALLTGCDQETPGETGATSFENPREAMQVAEQTFTPPAPEPEPEPEPVSIFPYLPTNANLLTLSGAMDVFAFATHAEDSTPKLTKKAKANLEEALDAVRGSEWDAGCILIDLETGRGVASGIDERVFGASAIKAPYLLYICQSHVETKGSTLDSAVGSGTLESQAYDTIVKSDNDAFQALRDSFNGSKWDAWLDNLGIGSSFSRTQKNPFYTARESAQMWLALHNYLDKGTETAEWLESLISSVNVSFVRHAIGGNGVSVMGKAGWYADKGDTGCDGFCEAGIVTEDGKDYLLCVMTSIPYQTDREHLFENIVKALWKTRSCLEVEEA